MSDELQNQVQSDPNKRKNKKKPKNFLKNAKKYAKKGQWGRGTKMSEELYQYFLGILDAMKAGIEDEDQRQSLVNNVLDRTKGEELNIIGNQLGCRVVELLLPYSSPEDLERYFEVLHPELRRLCSDNFTSHVVETLLRVASERATEHLQTGETNNESEDEVPKKKIKLEPKQSKYSDSHVKNCYEFALKICKYALNNLEDFVWDNYANHILRSALKCLSGITLLPNEKPKVNMFVIEKTDKQTPPSPYIKKMVYKNVPDDYKELVTEFAKRLSVWPQLKDLPYQNLTSGLLQVLLYAIKNVDKNLTRDLLKQLLNESFAPDNCVSNGNDDTDDKKEVKIDMDEENQKSVVEGRSLPPVFESEPAVRLLEAALLVAKKKMYTQIYAKCFINRLEQLACMPMLNYTVQRLFDNCQIKEELEPMFDELSNKFADLLACGNTGVLVSVAKACLRVKARQAQFANSLESALKVTPDNQKYFPVFVLRLLPADRVEVSTLEKEYFINVHGSVILQSILDYQRPAKAVNGLLELTPEQLLVIFSDAKGSHVADAFCKGQFVGVKARDKMIWKLKGYYQTLALSQHGSRALERIFEAASRDQKVRIMAELADKSNLLNSTKFGRVVAAKLDVEGFKKGQKQWEQKFKGK
ncbi:nucleolar protein 9 [Cydia pomonella]|uniref:nucleolar protein 9 n=1 Tax=Cydia pomonella TaxID=82600 RepID=UPI002ADE3F81|nr:nucleolar protein 9 [Cydia pomonella]